MKSKMKKVTRERFMWLAGLKYKLLLLFNLFTLFIGPKPQHMKLLPQFSFHGHLSTVSTLARQLESKCNHVSV